MFSGVSLDCYCKYYRDTHFLDRFFLLEEGRIRFFESVLTYTRVSLASYLARCSDWKRRPVSESLLQDWKWRPVSESLPQEPLMP